MLISMHFCWS